MRLLFVSPADLHRPSGGRAMLGRLHLDAMIAVLGDGVARHRLDRSAPAGSSLRIRGFIDGATPAGITAVIAAIDAHAADAVWLDGSNLGRLVQAIRRARPRVRILTFCHNVEARFFLGALRRAPGVHAAGVLAGNYAAERLAVRDSHDVVALSARDQALLHRLYRRGADHVLPMAIADCVTDRSGSNEPVGADAPLIFVGGAFYANQAGIEWFARKVAPRTDARILVIGQGMEAMRQTLEATPNVSVVGAVEALEPYYRSACAAIAPIFDGSGMKTKVAEALMFGKAVIGTAEAWSGYDGVPAQAGWRCDTAAEFVAAIAAVRAIRPKALDPALRNLYERDYSIGAVARRFAAILS